jgi:hypothetical protein
MARARAPGSPLIYFCQLYRASSCWYFCWYRQQWVTKIILNSIGYGIKQLSARGTKIQTLIITITYTIGLIPYFQENFRGALKTHAKVHRSRPFCWHFCWYQLALRFASA